MAWYLINLLQGQLHLSLLRFSDGTPALYSGYLSLETSYNDNLSWISSVLPDKCQDQNRNQDTTAPFHSIYNPLHLNPTTDKFSWTAPDGMTHSQIGHVLIVSRSRAGHLDVRLIDIITFYLISLIDDLYI
jgi:hypothetical protein